MVCQRCVLDAACSNALRNADAADSDPNVTHRPAPRWNALLGFIWIVAGAGAPGEQYTMFFKDPSGNALEFKAMTNPDNLFAKYVVQ